MKKTFRIACLAVGMTAMTACGSMPSTQATAQTPVKTTQSEPQQGSVLGSLLGGLASQDKQENSSGIGNIIGQLIGSVTGTKTIVGSWTYTEPSVQFESENFLAQAGGAVATKSVVEKIQPYYEKVGIKHGMLAYTFNEDKTCTVTLGSKNIEGTYEYDKEANTLVITNKFGMKIMTAFATVSNKNLALTFDATKLLLLTQTLGAKSTNQTISGLTSLSKSFKGMKMGFMFDRK